jgi:hypothetical protein
VHHSSSRMQFMHACAREHARTHASEKPPLDGCTAHCQNCQRAGRIEWTLRRRRHRRHRHHHHRTLMHALLMRVHGSGASKRNDWKADDLTLPACLPAECPSVRLHSRYHLMTSGKTIIQKTPHICASVLTNPSTTSDSGLWGVPPHQSFLG